MKSTGIVFKQREFYGTDPGTIYEDVSREHRTCTPTALDYTQLPSGLWVPVFNGSTTIINLADDFIGVGDFTMQCWVYAISLGENDQGYILSNGKVVIRLSFPANPRFQSGRDGSASANANNDSIIFNTWLHLMVTSTITGTTRHYVDAVDETNGINGGTPAAGTANVFVSLASRAFDGYISGLEVYSFIPASPVPFATARYNEKALLYGEALI